MINFLDAPLISSLNLYHCMRKFLVNLQTKNEHLHKYFPMLLDTSIIMANLSLIHCIHFKSNYLYENSSLIVSFETMLDARIKPSTPKCAHFYFQLIIANLGKPQTPSDRKLTIFKRLAPMQNIN